MAQTSDGSAHPRRRGNLLVRAILTLIGLSSLSGGLLFTVAGVYILIDEGDTNMLYLLPFTFAFMALGIVLIVSQLGTSSAKGGQAQPGTRSAQADGDGGADDVERIVSTVPLAGSTQAAGAQATPAAGVQAPQATGAQAPQATATDPRELTEDVANLVHRSSDVVATLRDLVRHEQAPDSQKRHLVSMLEAAGVPDYRDAPVFEGGRLSRNTHYWLRFPVEELDDEAYDTLISVEAALNINQDLPALRALPLDDERCLSGALKLMRSLCDQEVARGSLTDLGLTATYRHTDADATAGEWVVRSLVCSAAESVRVPFRLPYDMNCNCGTGLVVIDLVLPRPRCMAIFTPDPSAQAALARAYALRISTLLARHAFDASPKVRRVVVNCCEHGSKETLLSLDLDPAVLAALLTVARDSSLDKAFPIDPSIRALFSPSGWFTAVEPFVALNDPQAVPEAARRLIEMDTRQTSEAVARICHATRVCDLGINENTPRIDAWESVRDRLGSTTEQAVSALVALRDEANDITVTEACARTIQALVEGRVELDNLAELGSLFVNGSSFDVTVRRAVEMLNEANGTPDPAGALELLEKALAPVDDMGAYLDDETCVYRYFGSISERIHHNAHIDEGGREIRLVPDAYFNAHHNASIALGMLGRNEEALAHADVCMRLAPTSAYVTMRKVRVLEAESRIYEAADLIIRALGHAVTPLDASMCHYRLAYMEWKLGREDLAVACYQRSLAWESNMADQAREELDDLLASSPNLSRLTDEQAEALLAREGIPLGCTKADEEHTLAAAVACMDDEVFYAARSLMGEYFRTSRDDVVMGVYRSLSFSS